MTIITPRILLMISVFESKNDVREPASEPMMKIKTSENPSTNAIAFDITLYVILDFI